MKDFEKRIQIDDSRILIYQISQGYAKPTYTITEAFLENDKIVKTYSLFQWDDYGFYGWTKNNDTRKISFEFDINHPLYFPLLHFLNYDDKILIDDDSSRENNKKYILVYKQNNKIYIDFINKLLNKNSVSEKFYIFIKNIFIDGRSKIDREQKNTKEKLYFFFKEINKEIVEEHQITIEEYLINNNLLTEEESKKYIKKIKYNY